MFDFHEKRKIRSFLYSRWVIGSIFLVALLLSISVYNRYTVAHDMKMKLDERRTELGKLKQRAEVFDAKVKYLEDERGVEEELRNRFDVAKDGEQVVILLDERSGVSHAETNVRQGEENVPEESSFFESLKFWD